MPHVKSTLTTVETKAARAWRWVERDRFRETTALALALISLGLGIAMLTDPVPFERPTFDVARR